MTMTKINPVAKSPFASLLGMELLEWTPGKAVIALNIVEKLQNRRGDAHGGVTSSLLDMALGIACQSPDGEWATMGTISLTVNFLLPGHGRLVAEGRLIKAGNTVAFTEGEARDESGAIIAKATGCYKMRRKKQV